jgi:triosephosphate isomerase
MMKLLFVANWKMHKTIGEATAYARRFAASAPDLLAAELVVAPPFTALESVARTLRGSGVALAGQNLYHEDHGAFTGEIAPSMLLDVGCTFVIVGHSERRRLFGETDQSAARRARAALAAGLIPIACVGETLEQREAGSTQAVIQGQLGAVVDGLRLAASQRLVVAYEPVWAIGTGRNATVEQAAEAHRWLREGLRPLGAAAERVQILYGGSVNMDNIGSFTASPWIQGALVGGASLEPEGFAELVRRGLAGRARQER